MAADEGHELRPEVGQCCAHIRLGDARILRPKRPGLGLRDEEPAGKRRAGMAQGGREKQRLIGKAPALSHDHDVEITLPVFGRCLLCCHPQSAVAGPSHLYTQVGLMEKGWFYGKAERNGFATEYGRTVGLKWWATLESNQACVSARELQSPATPCGLSPTAPRRIAPDVGA